jgi:uncharacterized protein YutE (UPF0331/DUF86 family)
MPTPEVLIPTKDARRVQETFIALLNPQNQERSMIIVLASVLEELMEDVLGLTLSPKLIPYTADGKIRKLHELKLIDEDTRDCLSCIRDIRNYYAHEPNAKSLKDAAILSRTTQLIRILERVFNIKRAAKDLDEKIQSLVDSLSGPGNTWSGRFSDEAQAMRSGFFYLSLQLLAVKSTVSQSSTHTPLPLGQFTVKISTPP